MKPKVDNYGIVCLSPSVLGGVYCSPGYLALIQRDAKRFEKRVRQIHRDLDNQTD